MPNFFICLSPEKWSVLVYSFFRKCTWCLLVQKWCQGFFFFLWLLGCYAALQGQNHVSVIFCSLNMGFLNSSKISYKVKDVVHFNVVVGISNSFLHMDFAAGDLCVWAVLHILLHYQKLTMDYFCLGNLPKFCQCDCTLNV